MTGRRPDILYAAGPAADLCRFEAVPVTFEAAAADENGKPRPPTYSMVAYNGGPMLVDGWDMPVVVDCAGCRTEPQGVPNYRDHDPSKVVGHCTKVEIAAAGIRCSGVLSGTGPDAREVADNARNGFPWRASIGTRNESIEEVRAGASAQANGRTVDGPAYIIRKSRLAEISFVPRGADPSTHVKVAASAAKQKETAVKTFEEWLKAKGLDLAALKAGEKTALEAEWKAECGAPPVPPQPDPPAEPDPAPDALKAAGDEAAKAVRAAAKGEIDRLAAVEKVASEFKGKVETKKFAELHASAIDGKIDARDFELQCLRAARPAAPAAGRDRHSGVTPECLAAAACLSGGFGEERTGRAFGDQILQAAIPLRRIGLRDLLAIACRLEGVDPGWISGNDTSWVKAAFSTVSVPNILANTAGKVMLGSYRALDSAAVRICRILSASDFKAHTAVRLSGDYTFNRVGQDGTLPHAVGIDQGYPFQVDTYGRIFGVTRQMIVNDDVGAFLEIPRLLGRGAALRREALCLTLILANTGNFFHSNNKNFITGSTTVLGVAGLTQALTAFAKQTDEKGGPMLMLPKLLLVPPELKPAADQLYVSTRLNTGGAATTEQVPDANSFAGKYEPIQSAYLSTTGFHASVSAVAWYLFGDPADVAAFGLAYLNGVDTPTIEDAPLSGEYLGQAWRGYLDMGVCQLDPRGAVMSRGS